MDKISISEIYPLSEIILGSELYYVCELGKYLSTYGKQLSLNGISLNNVLKKSRYWDSLRVAYKMNWVCDLTCSESDVEITPSTEPNVVDLNNKGKVVNKLFIESDSPVEKGTGEDYEPLKFRVHFLPIEGRVLTWARGSLSNEIDNVIAMGSSFTSQSLVSLIAYAAIKRFMTGEFDKFCLELDSTILRNEHAISDILLLESRTQALNDWYIPKYDMDSERLDNLGYEAWLYMGRELGYEQREYEPDEKLENFKRLGFDKGDVVSLYERKVTQKGNMVKSICNFHYALVKEVNKSGIELSMIQTKSTKYEADLEFESLTMAAKKMYGSKPDNSKIRTKNLKFNWYDIGVEYMMDAEQYFIAPLQGDDFVTMRYPDKSGVCQEVLVNEMDYIYWLLKDYHVEFPEEKFLIRYFKNRTPVYNTLIG